MCRMESDEAAQVQMNSQIYLYCLGVLPLQGGKIDQ